MKTSIVFVLSGFFLISCSDFVEVDTTPPAAPRGVLALSLDKAVRLDWLPNTEPDLAGYKVWVSNRYDGKYEFIGRTRDVRFTDVDVRNGTTYYYAISAYDFAGNESGLSTDYARATPRPEGFNTLLSNFRVSPGTAGYDFSTYSVGHYNDDYTDFFYEYDGRRAYLNVWNDTDIQGMGYTRSLDDITVAPSSGWSPSKSVEAIEGHTYVIWTWDDHYAKVRLITVSQTHIIFDWAYQTAKSNPDLKRNIPEDGKRNLEAMRAIPVHR